MCGIAGEIRTRGTAHQVSVEGVTRLRDRLAHRGPDDAGLWRGEGALIAHRRLSVVDPGPSGHQPLVSPDGRYVLTYNGELYNDAELREELTRAGAAFTTSCDTETVLLALTTWGKAGIARLRGMFAIALWDTLDRTLLLARDPMGVKPLHYARIGDAGLVFASEAPSIFEHGSLDPRPDIETMSAYLTTVRTTVGERTLFHGVRTLLPGQILEIDASREVVTVAKSFQPRGDILGATDLGRVIRESVLCHLRSDVPTCSLLSGGIDSTVVATVAMAELGRLDTYCSGALNPDADDDDFSHAARAAKTLGTRHIQAPVSKPMFLERWRELVHAIGSPLSTPNEVAINEVARTLRADGKVVALSGEGADELLGGYELPMTMIAKHVGTTDASADAGGRGGVFQIRSNEWVNAQLKQMILNEPVWNAIEGDAVLMDFAAGLYCSLEAEVGADFPDASEHEQRMQTHLRYQRAVNLEGLLRRLDTATMYASVEGRTPFADRVVARYCESLPMDQKFIPQRETTPVRTKVALREAFGGAIPAHVVQRKKASFPLPFEGWIGEASDVLTRSAFAAEIFQPSALVQIAQQPRELWNIAWPVMNLAIWGERWWG